MHAHVGAYVAVCVCICVDLCMFVPVCRTAGFAATAEPGHQATGPAHAGTSTTPCATAATSSETKACAALYAARLTDTSRTRI